MYIPNKTRDRARITDTLVPVLVALLDTFSSFGIQKYCKDCSYIESSYNYGSITCTLRFICSLSQNTRPLGHVLGMLDGIWHRNGPKT
jgi:hypothetical protein